MAKMMMLIDPSRCTGCRGCQVACKQWNENLAVKTTFTGSYQNPPDLDGDTFTLVRFQEELRNDFDVYWLMTSDRCRHCSEPTCIEALPKESYVLDPTGAVVFNEKAKAKLGDVVDACPFGIPTQNKKTGQIVKCTLCVDRISDDMLPACAKACPTGAILWGDYDGMLDYAKKRMAWLKGPANTTRFKADKIKLYPGEGFPSHVKWLLIDDQAKHGLKGEV